VSSNVAVATYTISAANPVFAPASGTFYAPVTVTMTDATPGVLIYYSTTGFPTTSSPSCASPCQILIPTTTTLRAMAAGAGISQSGTTVGTYTIAANAPVFTPGSGTYAHSVSVTMTDSTAGVLIYYSTTGFPTTSSPSCASPCQITISTSTILRAMAAGTGISQSSTTVGSYTITP
jgi:chitinase